MSGSPRVSVVLPTYNAVEFVEEAVESLLGQTFADFEVVVVDDGSTDGTLARVRSFDDDRIRIVERDESGLAGALNRGVSEARGEYVARQDADDRSARDRLARQVAHLDANPDVALVGTGAYLLDESGTVTERRRVLACPTPSDLLAGNPFVHGTVMMRADALERVGGYDERFAVTEDFDLWLRLAEDHAVRNIDAPLYALRLRGGSIYGSDLARVKLYRRLAVRRVRGSLSPAARADVDRNGIDALYDHLGREERLAHHREMAMELLRYDRPAEARDHCRRALSCSTLAPTVLGLYSLSYAPRGVVDRAERAYRSFLNLRIRLRNRRCRDAT